VVQDCLFLALVMLLSLILYVRGLGFYDDDWAMIHGFSLAQGQGFAGLYHSYSIWTSGSLRPAETTYYSALYVLFGPRPLGYHVINASILMMGILLFYLLLRELNLNRLLALAVPMVYGLLPHYSTDRFWFAASASNLSMALYFLSLYCDLRTIESRQARLWAWKTLSVLALLGSTLAYEVFLPLFFLNPLIILYRKRQLDRTGSMIAFSKAKLAVLTVGNLLALLLVIGFKVHVLKRLGRSPHPDLPDQIRYLVEGFWALSYRRYGSGLPRLLWKILHEYPSTEVFGLGGLLSIIMFAYLYLIAGQSRFKPPKWIGMVKLIGLGLAISGLSYTIFITTYRFGFTPATIGNRTAIAGAVGIALSFVGVLAWICSLPRSEQLKRFAFCVSISILGTSGFLIINTIASFWTGAYRQEKEILADIHQHVPTLPSGSTLLLDGICPYIGPAVVFHSQSDLRGALAVTYRYSNLEAAVVKPALKVKEEGISTLTYGEEQLYPYKHLFVYHFGRKMTVQLENAESARRYFAEFDPDFSTGCPQYNEGEGVPIF
jgi:hypothetical protein